jgi:phage terminase large subunit-like protein
MAKVAEDTPSELNTFLRYHLNIWTEQDVSWVPVDKWDACVEEYSEGELEGERCYAGLDLAATRDINAFVLYFPDSRRVLPFFWVPRSALAERQRQKKTRLDSWANRGLIRVTDGEAADYDVIERDILEIAGRFRIQQVGLDRWNALQISNHLMDAGLEMATVGQGYASMSSAMKMLERAVVRADIRHDGNPVLRWMFGNVAVKQDPAGNIKPDKSKAGDKIDGIVALMMALFVWGEAEGPSAYETGGIDFV